MKKILSTLMLLTSLTASAQTIQDGNYRTVGYIKSDGTV